MSNANIDREGLYYSEIPAKKKNSPQGAQNCCIALISLIFAVCFGVFTHVESKYGSADCELTSFMTWSKAVFLYNLLSLLLTVCALPWLASAGRKVKENHQLLPQNKDKPKNMPNQLAFIINGLLSISGFTLFIGLSVTYTNDSEGCGELRNLALAYIIITGIGFGIIFSLLCCLGCIGYLVGNIKFGERYLNNAGLPAQK